MFRAICFTVRPRPGHPASRATRPLLAHPLALHPSPPRLRLFTTAATPRTRRTGPLPDAPTLSRPTAVPTAYTIPQVSLALTRTTRRLAATAAPPQKRANNDKTMSSTATLPRDPNRRPPPTLHPGPVHPTAASTGLLPENELNQINRMLQQVKELPQTTTMETAGVHKNSSLEQISRAIDAHGAQASGLNGGAEKRGLGRFFQKKIFAQSKAGAQMAAMQQIGAASGALPQEAAVGANKKSSPLWKRLLKGVALGAVALGAVNMGFLLFSERRLSRFRELAENPEALWASIEEDPELKAIYAQIQDIGQPLVFAFFQGQLGDAGMLEDVLVREKKQAGEEFDQDAISAEIDAIAEIALNFIVDGDDDDDDDETSEDPKSNSDGGAAGQKKSQGPLLNESNLPPALDFFKTFSPDDLTRSELQSSQQLALKHLLIIQELVKVSRAVLEKYHEFTETHVPGNLPASRKASIISKHRTAALEQAEAGDVPNDAPERSMDQWQEEWDRRGEKFKHRAFPNAAALPDTISELEAINVSLLKTAVQLIFFYHNTAVQDLDSIQSQALRDTKRMGSSGTNLYTHFYRSYQEITQAKLALRRATNLLIYFQSICNDRWWLSAPSYFKHNFQGVFSLYDDVAFKNYKIYQKDQVERFVHQHDLLRFRRQGQYSHRSPAASETPPPAPIFQPSPPRPQDFIARAAPIDPRGFQFVEPSLGTDCGILDQLAASQCFAVKNQRPVLFQSQTLTPEEIRALSPPSSPHAVIDCLQFPKALPQSIASLEGREFDPWTLALTSGNTAGLGSSKPALPQPSIPAAPLAPVVLTPESVVSYDPDDYESGPVPLAVARQWGHEVVDKATADGSVIAPRTHWYYVPTPKFPTLDLVPAHQQKQRQEQQQRM